MATLTNSKLHVVFVLWMLQDVIHWSKMQLYAGLFNSYICLMYFLLQCEYILTCHLCMPCISDADPQNSLFFILPPALKRSPQWSQPGDSEWKAYCMWPYMSSWGRPTAICTQKWYKAWWLNLEEESRLLHNMCSVGSERTIFSKGLGRSRAVLAKWC